MFDAEVLKLWIEQNPNWISFSFFFIAFFESFAGLGLFMPGVILLAAAAGLANLYNINPFEILIYGYIGACSADILSFLIGNFFRNKIDSIWPFSSYPEALSKGRSFFEKYGIYSIIIGRFIGPIRPILPILAGTLNMSKQRFIAIDLFSGIPWVCFYILPPYYVTKTITENFILLPYLIGIIFLILVMLTIKKFIR